MWIGKNKARTSKKLLINCVLLIACAIVASIFMLKIYLETPHACSLLSKKLTTYLRQSVRVSGLHTTGGAVQLTGVVLSNPSGDYHSNNLVEFDSIVIAPRWGDLLAGRWNFNLIALTGVRLTFSKNSEGVWNYSNLRQLLSGKKTTGTGVLIEKLIIQDGAVQINGQAVRGVSITLLNFVTNSPSDSQFKLSFEDVGRDSYMVSGTVRQGHKPSFDLTLAAPSLSLNRLAELFKLKDNLLPAQSKGKLKMAAAYREGRLRIAGRLDLSRFPVPVLKKNLPVTGCITFAATYNIATDDVVVESLTMTGDNLVSGHASGTVSKVQSERRFTVYIGIDHLNLAELAFMLPERVRRIAVVNGSLEPLQLRFSGSASQGLTRAAGVCFLKNGVFESAGRRYAAALNSVIRFSGEKDGFLIKGTLNQNRADRSAILESLQAPFEIHLSRQFKLLKADVSSLQAKIMGVTVGGNLGYSALLPTPYSIDLQIPVTSLSSLQTLSKKLGLQPVSGSGSLYLRASGRGLRDFTALAVARVVHVRSARIDLNAGDVEAHVIMKEGQPDVSGNVRFDGLVFDKRVADACFSYRITNGTVFLDNVAFNIDETFAVIARLTAKLSLKDSVAEAVHNPVSVELAGGEIRRGDIELRGVSGQIDGMHLSDPAGSWLEGTAAVSVLQAFWQGQAVAVPSLNAAFSRTAVRGAVSGSSLEGILSGSVAIDPRALQDGAGFQIVVSGGKLSSLGSLLLRSGAVTLSRGTFDSLISGRYSHASGFISRFSAASRDVAVTGSGGKDLLGGGSVKLSGSLSGARLVVDDALFSVGGGVALQVSGELDNPLTKQRSGSFVFALPQVSLSSLIDRSVNILPRVIQEATVGGTLASGGRFVLRNGRQLLDGDLVLKDALFAVPSRKFRAADIHGRIPFSLDLSGNTPTKIAGTSGFTRENYPLLLKKLHVTRNSGHVISIGSVDFGPVNLGATRMQISAENGVTKLDSLSSSLYEGNLLGTGYMMLKNGINYRTDLLINGFSLKRFCATFPSIKDYISGRLDGIVSVTGKGRDMVGVTGFSDLWVREGSGEKMLVSKDFLQKLSGRKLRGFFFSADRPFDQAEVSAVLAEGNLTFEKLDISNTNFFGVRDLNVSIAPTQNRITIEHLFTAIRQAAERGKTSDSDSAPPVAEQEFTWQE